MASGRVSGYVWVVAAMDKVYYFYKESRQAGFLKELRLSIGGVSRSGIFGNIRQEHERFSTDFVVHGFTDHVALRTNCGIGTFFLGAGLGEDDVDLAHRLGCPSGTPM